MTKHPSYLYGVLAFVTLNVLIFGLAQGGPLNPYNLVTESQLEQQQAGGILDHISAYWNHVGKPGQFKGQDNITIHYMTFIREDEKGAIVISSGRTESYIKYKDLVYDLGKQGYSVYIHDHRGQGFSGRMTKDSHKGHVNKFSDYIKDLKYFVDHVVKQKPHAKLFILGHLMGGGIATRYIEVHPMDFHAAALSSPMHEPDAAIIYSAKGGCAVFRKSHKIFDTKYAGRLVTRKPYKRTPFEKNKLTHSRVRYTIFRDAYDEHDQVKLGGPTTGWVAEACDAGDLVRREAAKIKIPVLVLQAEQDTAVTPEGQNEFCENLGKSGENQCEGGAPQVIAGAYHELLIEQDAFRIPALTRILDFFAAH